MYTFEDVSPTEERSMKKTHPFKVLYRREKDLRRKYFHTKSEAEEWLDWAKKAVEEELPLGVTLDLRASKPYLARKKGKDGNRGMKYWYTLAGAVEWLAAT